MLWIIIEKNSIYQIYFLFYQFDLVNCISFCWANFSKNAQTQFLQSLNGNEFSPTVCHLFIFLSFLSLLVLRLIFSRLRNSNEKISFFPDCNLFDDRTWKDEESLRKVWGQENTYIIKYDVKCITYIYTTSQIRNLNIQNITFWIKLLLHPLTIYYVKDRYVLQ